MDLSKLSNEDLLALKAGDLSKVSNEGLMSLRGETPKPAVQSLGGVLRDIPRQAGLVARTGVKAAAGIPGMLSDGLTGIYNTGANAIQGEGSGFRFQSAQSALDSAMDRTGLPSPQGANERVITDAGGMLLGAGGLTRVADKLAQTPSAIQEIWRIMSAKPVIQGVNAATAGISGGSVREAGGGPFEQFAASLAGGLTGGIAADKAAAITQTAARAMTPRTIQLQKADTQIGIILERSGIDWGQIPERVKQTMRDEVAAALTTGQPLNADAIRRLLVFQRTGTTPTVGMLTQNPGQITREQNLAKTAANMTDEGMQRLPGIQNANVTRLLAQLDEAGATRAPTATGAAEAAIRDLTGRQQAAEGRINSLYSAARDTNGRSLPLQGGAFSQRANQLLDEAMVGGALPADVSNTMNRIARGEMPFTVEIAEQLKTRIGTLQRSSNDGTVRHALGLIRRALDETPLRSMNPENLPAVPGAMTAQDAGEQSIQAFNQARSANREWMRRIENNPALRAVVDGVEPDRFIERFIVGRGATAANVRALRTELGPEGAQAIKDYLVSYLRDAATNNTDDIAKFSNASYRKALRDIGNEKLSMFFNADELRQLRDIGDAAKYMQAQPAGAAVNNSNSGALVLGRGIETLDRLSSWLPVGRDVVRGKITGPMLQSEVLSPRNALLGPRIPQTRPLPVNPLLAGTILAPQDGKDDRRY